jgi:hypothetical protein
VRLHGDAHCLVLIDLFDSLPRRRRLRSIYSAIMPDSACLPVDGAPAVCRGGAQGSVAAAFVVRSGSRPSGAAPVGWEALPARAGMYGRRIANVTSARRVESCVAHECECVATEPDANE